MSRSTPNDRNMRLRVARALERILSAIEEWAGELRRRVAFCPTCGRNRYSGAPCQNVEPDEPTPRIDA